MNNISQLRLRLEEIQGSLVENEYDGLLISKPQNVKHVLMGNPNSDLLSGVHTNELAIKSGIETIPGYLLISKEKTYFATYWYKLDQAYIEVLNKPNISISSIGMTIDESNDSKGRQEVPLVDIISISLDVRWILELLNQFHIKILGWDENFIMKSFTPKGIVKELLRIKEFEEVTICSGINLDMFGLHNFD